MSQKNVDKLMPPVMPTKEPLKRNMSQKNLDKLMPPILPTKEPLKILNSLNSVKWLIELLQLLKNAAFCATSKRIFYRFYSCFTIQTPSICAKLQDCNNTCIDEFRFSDSACLQCPGYSKLQYHLFLQLIILIFV